MDFIKLKKCYFSMLNLILEQEYYGLDYYGQGKIRFDEVFKSKIEKARKLYFDIVSLKQQIDDKKEKIMKIMN